MKTDASVLEIVTTTIGTLITAIAMIICPIIAHKKGRSAVGWFFGGLLLGGIGIIIVACLSDVKEEQEQSQEELDSQYFENLNTMYVMGKITKEEFEEALSENKKQDL